MITKSDKPKVKKEMTSLPETDLVGIQGRTCNSDELKGNGVIQATWRNFYEQGIYSKLSALTEDKKVFAAYFDYTSDKNGYYSFFIGMAGIPKERYPRDCISITTPNQSYSVVQTASGNLQSVGIQAWQYIWDENWFTMKRTYKMDLEVYGEQAVNPEYAQFDIFIGTTG